MAGYGYGYFKGGVPIGSNVNQKDPDFIITIDTTKAGSASNTFVFPLEGKTANNVIIDWGDGSADSYSTVGDKTHVYASPGTYQIRINKEITYVKFANTGDKLKLIYIDNWGSSQWSNMRWSFYGCSNMIGRYNDFPNTTNVNDMQRTFYGCALFNQPLNFDTSKVINMYGMFYGCVLFNQPLNFNTSKVINMYRMFYYAASFNQDLSGFDIANVTDLGSFAEGTTINTTNYDKILVSWGSQEVKPNLSTSFSPAKYSAVGKVGRDILIAKGWTIEDGGLIV